ncbi:YycH family regulatory protein [Falsibacillus pallidus]|uniref:YycH family regulatory protein n=1 Tax=Falsibacillus pallidus TaxID=493781 RepID=UPI003D99F037
MRYETIKSILLTVLVITSIVLTWNLWTYQPDYEVANPNNLFREVTISDKKEASSLIKPSKIFFHQNDAHYGTFNGVEMNRIVDEMKKWTFYDFRNITSSVTRSELLDIQHSNGKVQILFPDEVPITLYKGALKFEETKIPSVTFNEIVINLSNIQKESVVYFISNEPNSYKVYECNIRANYLTNFQNTFAQEAPAKYISYFPHDINDHQTIYLPKTRIDLTMLRYYMTEIDVNKFKNALFSDPSDVRKSQLANLEEFTDGSSLMRVNKLTNYFSYINPAEESNLTDSPHELIQKSIDFINGHAGWTDQYHYFSLNSDTSMVSFLLYKNGLPVFNDEGMSEITEYWGKDEIYKYMRPNFTLDVSLPWALKVTLPSGYEVLDYLKNNPDIKPKLLQDFTIGYKLSRDPQNPQTVVLEPSWYYMDSGSWIRLSINNAGGTSGGLE